MTKQRTAEQIVDECLERGLAHPFDMPDDEYDYDRIEYIRSTPTPSSGWARDAAHHRDRARTPAILNQASRCEK